MTEPWLLSVDFPSYLEAKIEIDDRSLHPRLLTAVRGRIHRREQLRLLDIGTGTGAMLRRLLEPLPPGGTEMVGLDSDRRSLELAARSIRRQLEERGARVDAKESVGEIRLRCLPGAGSAGELVIRLLRGRFLSGESVAGLGARPFDLITAHAFLDLLPVEAAVEAIRSLLRPGGWLYATINYDGLTALLPPDPSADFEQLLLGRYDQSMEERRVGDRPTAGRWSGRRLCQCLPGCGFAVRDVGASDWVVLPDPKGHSPGHRVFLRTLLTFVAREGLAGGMDPASLQDWYARRLEGVERGTTGLMTHQLDVLAELPG